MVYKCYICGEEIKEGEKITELQEGSLLMGEVVDKEIHYCVHTTCLYVALTNVRTKE